MYRIVRFRRRHGKRHLDRELNNDLGVIGEIPCHLIGQHMVMHLYAWGGIAAAADLLPPLYDPKLPT
jgi:hypothetical protein